MVGLHGHYMHVQQTVASIRFCRQENRLNDSVLCTSVDCVLTEIIFVLDSYDGKARPSHV